jgi:hypothetical protein
VRAARRAHSSRPERAASTQPNGSGTSEVAIKLG